MTCFSFAYLCIYISINIYVDIYIIYTRIVVYYRQIHCQSHSHNSVAIHELNNVLHKFVYASFARPSQVCVAHILMRKPLRAIAVTTPVFNMTLLTFNSAVVSLKSGQRC